MTMLRWPALVPLLISAIIMVGCAKRPATTQASAPAPLGAAGAGARIAGDAGQSGGASAEDGAGEGDGARSAHGGDAAGGSDAGSAQAGAGAGAGDDRGRAAEGSATTGAGERGAIAGRDAGSAGDDSGRASGGASREGATDGSATDGSDSGAAGARSAAAGSDGRGSKGSAQGPSEGPAQIASAAAGASGDGQGNGAPGVMMAAARPEVREFVSISELGDVHFDFDRYDIRPEDARILNANAEWLKANPEHLLLIEGHCDERGTNEYNLALGEHRAKSAMNYLISQGVQSSRMTIISYGEERPACTDKSESCWSSNRRAHFLVKSH